MDSMKSNFIIKRNKKGKSENALIKGGGEKEKDIEDYYSFFSFELKSSQEELGFQEKP